MRSKSLVFIRSIVLGAPAAAASDVAVAAPDALQKAQELIRQSAPAPGPR